MCVYIYIYVYLILHIICLRCSNKSSMICCPSRHASEAVRDLSGSSVNANRSRYVPWSKHVKRFAIEEMEYGIHQGYR